MGISGAVKEIHFPIVVYLNQSNASSNLSAAICLKTFVQARVSEETWALVGFGCPWLPFLSLLNPRTDFLSTMESYDALFDQC